MPIFLHLAQKGIFATALSHLHAANTGQSTTDPNVPKYKHKWGKQDGRAREVDG